MEDFLKKLSLSLTEGDMSALEGNNIFKPTKDAIVSINAMILAVVSLLSPDQIAAFPQAYADKLAELKLSKVGPDEKGG